MLLLWKFKTLDTSVLKQKSIYVWADKICSKNVKASFCGNVLSPPRPSEFFSKARKKLRMEKKSEKNSDKPVILHFRQVKKIAKTKFIEHFYWGVVFELWRCYGLSVTLWWYIFVRLVGEIIWWDYLHHKAWNKQKLQSVGKHQLEQTQKRWQQNKTWIIFLWYHSTPPPPALPPHHIISV